MAFFSLKIEICIVPQNSTQIISPGSAESFNLRHREVRWDENFELKQLLVYEIGVDYMTKFILIKFYRPE